MTMATEGREEKHIEFDHAIDGLERQVGKVGDLVDKVRGASDIKGEPGKEPVKPMISVTDFLGSGRERISKLTAQLTEYREELTNLLF